MCICTKLSPTSLRSCSLASPTRSYAGRSSSCKRVRTTSPPDYPVAHWPRAVARWTTDRPPAPETASRTAGNIRFRTLRQWPSRSWLLYWVKLSRRASVTPSRRRGRTLLLSVPSWLWTPASKSCVAWSGCWLSPVWCPPGLSPRRWTVDFSMNK